MDAAYDYVVRLPAERRVGFQWWVYKQEDGRGLERAAVGMVMSPG